MGVEILNPTEFPLDGDDPLALPHRTLNDYLLRLLAEGIVPTATVDADWGVVRTLHHEATTEILQLPVAQQLDCIRACARFSDWSRFEWGWSPHKPETQTQMGYEHVLHKLCIAILGFDRTWSEEEIAQIVQIAVPYGFDRAGLISPLVERHIEQHGVSDFLRSRVEEVREWNASLYRLPRWLGLGEALSEPLALHPGEAWADEALQFVTEQDENSREQWRVLLLHCVHCDKTRPSAKWLSTAKAHIDEMGLEVIGRCFVAWSDKYGQSTPTYEINQTTFRGLVWGASLLPSEAVVQSLFQVALSAARADMVNSPALTLNLFNACVWSLGQSNTKSAPDQLLELKRQVRGNRLKSVEKALQTVTMR